MKVESEKVGLKLNIQKTKIMASGPITSWQIDGKQCQTLFLGAPKSLQMVTAAMKLKDAYSLAEKLWISQARILEWVARPSCQGIFPNQGSNQSVLKETSPQY